MPKGLLLILASVVAVSCYDTTVDELKHELADLRTQVVKQTILIEKLAATHADELRQQNAKIETLENIVSMANIKLNFDEFVNTENDGTPSDKEKNTRVTRFSPRNSTVSAFYACISKNFANLSPHTDLVFDKVITDVGGEYNGNTGVFSPFQSGIYAFSWVILVSGRDPVHNEYGEVSVEILQNGINRGTIHADTEHNSDDDTASGFVILKLEEGDIVNLRTTTYAPNQGSFISNTEQGQWSFAGFRIA